MGTTTEIGKELGVIICSISADYAADSLVAFDRALLASWLNARNTPLNIKLSQTLLLLDSLQKLEDISMGATQLTPEPVVPPFDTIVGPG